MKSVFTLNGIWKLSHSNKIDDAPGSGSWINADVPGDVHISLSKKGILPKDLFYRKNMTEAKWVDEKYWWYKKTFNFNSKVKDNIFLVFDGLDTLAHVYLNGKKLGETNNMHLQYRFDIKDIIKKGRNDIKVQFFPIKREIRKLNKKYPDYFSIFLPGRSLVRKAQCQFGWDWAPDAPSLGIWKDVYIENYDNNTIRDVYVETNIDGQLCFRIELSAQVFDKILKLKIKDKGKYHSASVTTNGCNNFISIKLKNPRLWWPLGLGKQDMYDFTIELRDKVRVYDTYSDSFGIRKTEIVENIVEKDRMGFMLKINGKDVFCKGGNWVPSDCFPARTKDQQYEYLISRAVEANFNMLRIWGGGIYEKDKFYQECDRKGIMVWQDFMTACAEYPDDQDWFVNNIIEEAEYQVKRLRKYPSVVIWCGGNESSSSHRFETGRPGKNLTSYYLRGVTQDLHKDTPYVPSSPHSKSDFGQIQTSGETHWSTFPRPKTTDSTYGGFRNRIKEIRTVFNSEAKLQGPPPMEAVLKFADYKDIWPPNDIMDFHCMCHPYEDIHSRFVISQLQMADQIIGKCNNAEQFVANAMMGHAEMLREELEFYRSEKFKNSGVLVWMYNECWPCSNWAMIDYYGYLKAAYFIAKKIFAPLAVCIKRVYNDFTVHLLNDTLDDVAGKLELTYMDIFGKIYWTKNIKANCPANSSVCLVSIPPSRANQKNGFLRAVWKVGQQPLAANYFPQLWKDIAFEKANLTYKLFKKNIKKDGFYQTTVKIKSNNYSRFVFVTIPKMDVHEIILNDNYFDLIPGETKTVTVLSKTKLTELKIDSLINCQFS